MLQGQIGPDLEISAEHVKLNIRDGWDVGRSNFKGFRVPGKEN